MTPGRISLAALAALGLLSVPAQAETIQVIIDKLVFAPVDVNAKVGDTVEWVNKDHWRTLPRRRQRFQRHDRAKADGRTCAEKAGHDRVFL